MGTFNFKSINILPQKCISNITLNFFTCSVDNIVKVYTMVIITNNATYINCPWIKLGRTCVKYDMDHLCVRLLKNFGPSKRYWKMEISQMVVCPHATEIFLPFWPFYLSKYVCCLFVLRGVINSFWIWISIWIKLHKGLWFEMDDMDVMCKWANGHQSVGENMKSILSRLFFWSQISLTEIKFDLSNVWRCIWECYQISCP